MNTKSRLLALGSAACALALAATACGGSGDGGDSSGPVTLRLWSGATGAKQAAAAFNKTHDDVKIKYVNIPADKVFNNVSNAHKAGDASKAACLIQSDNREGSMLFAQGMVKDISKQLKPHESKFSDGATDALSIGGRHFGVPDNRSPIFTLFNKKIFDAHGLDYPKTWEELIEAGRKLKKDGIYAFNLAGEDPSTMMYIAWQAGARWYRAEGDAWKINFTDEASKRAARIMQTLLDEKLVSKISYTDYAAMMREYDKGKIASRQTSSWQLSGFQANLKTTLGNWEPAPNFTVPGQSGPLSASDTGGLTVPSLCEHSDEAVKAAVWLATNSAPVDAMASPEKGSGWYPAVKDPKPHLDVVVPKKLMGKHAEKAVPVITESARFAHGWVYGPNSKAMYEELADQWGKAMNGDVKVADILPHMQKWVVDDLKQRNVNVAE